MAATRATLRNMAMPPSRGNGIWWTCRSDSGPAIQPRDRARYLTIHVRASEMTSAAFATLASSQNTSLAPPPHRTDGAAQGAMVSSQGDMPQSNEVTNALLFPEIAQVPILGDELGLHLTMPPRTSPAPPCPGNMATIVSIPSRDRSSGSIPAALSLS